MSVINKFIIRGNQYIDISDYGIVIWGAGNNTRKLCASLQLDNIAYIVDNSINLIGKKIVLYGYEYTVSSPAIIQELDPKKYVIFIASIRYRKEIAEEIRNYFNKEYLVCDCEECFIRGYRDLKALFKFDPIIITKIYKGNISTYIDDYVSRINTIIETKLGGKCDIQYFFPIRDGIRISFILQKYDGTKFVFHIPTKKLREEYTPADRKYIREAYFARKEVRPDRDILIYLDEEGFEVSHYGETSIQWDCKDVIQEVLHKIKQVHECGIQVVAKRFPRERIVHKENFVRNYVSYFSEKLSEQVHKKCFAELENFKPTVCNGDFHKKNVVIYENRMVVIDWEWIGMSDLIWDISQFTCALWKEVSKESLSLKTILELYYGREPDLGQIYHASVLIAAAEYFGYLCYLVESNKANVKWEQDIMELVNELE